MILNMKGGVAKTTTVVNMAAILAKKYDKRILVTDADSQCNTTEFFGGDPTGGNLADALREKDAGVTVALNGIQHTAFPNIDLLPGDPSLMDLDLTKVETNGVRPTVLRELTRCLKKEKSYDYCLIDCPPAFNAASTAALIAADDVIIPIKLDAFSLRGMSCLLRQISNMRKINPKLRMAGLLPTMWYKSQTVQDAEETLRSSRLPVFPHIRRSDKVDEMTFAQDPLLISSPRSAAAIDYCRFVQKYVNGGLSK